MKNFALCGVESRHALSEQHAITLGPVARMESPIQEFGSGASTGSLSRSSDRPESIQSSGDRVCHGRSRYASATRGRCVGKF